ncbi:DUF6270 domain-containing protein [Zafaria sp. Z1313]|uniref:DUF6270 domain-containing protein n=1 Tax=unclassified Zafaria TaxID=2828765 RepID=UPI002E7A27BB|nr:DUF6270 domain-containing protein [Zafaria sp. J156]MEE1620776.1 DUF6270 domain-containing protein [Zafaria sp. J156]
MKKSIFMYGGCVTRDSFAYIEDEYRLVKYVARQSLISAGHPPVDIAPEQSRLESSFQNSQLRGDIESSLLPALRSQAASVDAVVLDLVVERLGVVKFGDGFLTRSNELSKSPAHALLTPEHEVVRFATPRHLRLWKYSARRLVQTLSRRGALERTVVLDTPWATHSNSGAPVAGYRNRPSEAMNELYRPYFAYLAELGVRVERLPDEFVVADDDHQWGVAPYHYVPAAYEWIASVVRSVPPPAS